MRARIAILGGDGIGPEVTQQSVRALESIARRFGHVFDFVCADIGGIAIDHQGTPLPDDTIKICSVSDAILLGAVGGPKWDDPKASVRPEQGLLGIRKHFDLFANLRPVKVLPQLDNFTPIKADLISGVDLLVVRELTGGIYFGKPSKQWETKRGRRAIDTLVYSEAEIERVVRLAFLMAAKRRKLLTSVDKANVLSSSRLWRQVVEEVAEDFPQVRYEHVLVDACAMHLIRDPKRFDVIVTENMFGDILTDEASIISGSMGMLPSASLGENGTANIKRHSKDQRFGLYEPIHGSAPDIAGKGLANPIASILSAALLLRYSLNMNTEAQVLERAVEEVVGDGHRTADLVTPGHSYVSTSEMGRLISEKVAMVML